MISFTELQSRLVNVVQLTPRDAEYDCPKCGGRATVRSFGRGWSAKCPQCGNLGEDDFRDANASDDAQSEASTRPAPRIESMTNRAVAQSVDASGLNPDITVGSTPTSPTSSAAQPAQSSRNNDVAPSGVGSVAIARVMPVSDQLTRDCSDGAAQPAHEVNQHRTVSGTKVAPTADNAAPAASLNGAGAGGGRPYLNQKLRHAIAYARHGMRVFPVHEIEREGCSCGKLACPSAGKHPRVKDWQMLATCDEDEISAWWKTWPGSNIGIACGEGSNLTVLDVDGDEGRWQLRGLEGENGELPETPVSITGSGGAHYYFAFEAGVGNAVKFAPGLDVRTEGGLVVGVGSATKQPYRWEAAFTLGSEGLMPARMPKWLADKIRSAGVPQSNGHLVLPGAIPAGERNNWLYRLTRSLKARGMSAGTILLAVQSENATRCSPPMPDDEIRALVDHATTEPDQRGFQSPTVQSPAEKKEIVIAWESFQMAVKANDAYLQRIPVIDKLCYSHAVSMITGGKHAGKSTLARWMAVCVAKGWPFLKREVTQGPVCYIASEDETMAARQELIRLGWADDDPLHFLSASNAPIEEQVEFLQALSRDLERFKVGLLVLDMLFDFVRIGDEMGYAETRRAVGEIQNVASATGTHIVVIHHAPKHASAIADAAVTALGSQGLAARVSPILLVRRHGPGVHSVVSTSIRDPRGEPMENSRLLRNGDGTLTLGGVWKDWMQAEVYKPQIIEILEAEEGQEMTANDLAVQLETTYRTAAAATSALYKEGKLGRSGSGRKGRPYRYSLMLTNISKTNAESNADGVRTSSKLDQEFRPDQGRFGYKD